LTILKEPQYIILQKCKLSAKRIETELTYLQSNLAKVSFLVQYIWNDLGLTPSVVSAATLNQFKNLLDKYIVYDKFTYQPAAGNTLGLKTLRRRLLYL
jgi:hypothetical protein